MSAKIPATVITGFLGAGKTSLIRHLLEQANGKRLALIINEFGELGVDREVLSGCGVEGCSDDDIVELTNGCICCTVADDFLPTIEALLARPLPPDHIIIETSGLALPKPLVKAFDWPDVRTRTTVDGVVTVIDCAAVAAGLFASDPAAVAAARAADAALDHDSPLEELFEEQLACADMVVLNKTDLVDTETLAWVEAEIRRQLRPGVGIVRSAGAKVDPAVALGLGAAAEDDLASRPSHHDDGHAHDHDDFESFVVAVPPLADPADLEARIRRVVADHPVLRVKGFAAINGKAMRHVFQGVGDRIQRYYDRPWQPGEERTGALVVIGTHGLDLEEITRVLAA